MILALDKIILCVWPSKRFHVASASSHYKLFTFWVIAYDSAGSTVVKKMRKQHVPTVIKSPLLPSKTLGGTGLKKPSWNISLSWRRFFLCSSSSSSHCVHRIFIPQWIHLTRPWASSIHTIHTRLLQNCPHDLGAHSYPRLTYIWYPLIPLCWWKRLSE